MRVGRRSCLAALIAAPGGLGRGALAQEGGVGRGAAQDDTLRGRGTPTGRVGAASRSGRSAAEGGMALDLVAPQRGVGLTASPQPTLYYMVSGPVAQPVQVTISARGQARPLLDAPLPRPRATGLHAVPLRRFGVQLAPDVLYVWSVAVTLDPQSPSNDVVGSALLQYRRAESALEHRMREAPTRDRPAALARAGLWYDAVAAAAEAAGDPDGQAALIALLGEAGLVPSAPQPAAASGR